MQRLFSAVIFVLMSAPVCAQTVASQIVNAPWETKKVGKGVTWKHHHFTSLFNSQQDVHIMEVDLNTPGVTVRFPYQTGGTHSTVSTFANTLNGAAAAAVNGQFFDSNGSTQYLKVDGNVINTTNPGAAEGGAIGVTSADATSLLLRPSGGWSTISRRHLMACGPVLVSNGNIHSFQNNDFMMGRHPRTAVGVTAANKMLVVVVDGRSATAAGMNLPELSQVFTAFSATTAINYDGGGSSTAWVRGESGNGVVNNPSDGQQRPVTNAIAVVADPVDVVLDTDKVVASASWSVGTSASDKFGPDYRFRSTQAVSDAAEWSWTTLQTRDYEVFAWWSQGSNRSASAPYVISRAGGTTTVNRNQQTNGGSWQSLGLHRMNQGTNSVKLSCWTTTGFVVIADAVKIVAR